MDILLMTSAQTRPRRYIVVLGPLASDAQDLNCGSHQKGLVESQRFDTRLINRSDTGRKVTGN